MAKRALEKKERSLGVKLFLKGERSLSPKAALTRKPYRPGMHGKRFSKVSEMGSQLREKQKVRFTYGLREEQMRRVFNAADKKADMATDQGILDLLERRLDNVVYRLGLAASRSMAKQMISHGHFLVDKRKVTISSILLKPGNTVSIREQSKEHPLFKELPITLKNYEIPSWLELNKETLEAKVLSYPKDVETPFDINLVVDYYSK